MDADNSRVCACVDPEPTHNATGTPGPRGINHTLRCNVCGLPLGPWYSPRTTATINSITYTKVKPNPRPDATPPHDKRSQMG